MQAGLGARSLCRVSGYSFITCVDDRKTSRISRSQHGWKQKAPAVMSTSGKPAFCVYTVPAPRVLGCQCGGGKIGLPSLSLVSLPLGLALGSPIFPSGWEGKLGVALESLQGEGRRRRG